MHKTFRVLSFDTHVGGYGRTKLLNRLYGHSRRSSDKTYRYPGMLERLPWVRLGMSVIGVPKDLSQEVESLMKEAEGRGELSLHAIDGTLPGEFRRRAMMELAARLGIPSKLRAIGASAKRGQTPRAQLIELEDLVDEIERVDVSDKKEVSKLFRRRLRSLRRRRIKIRIPFRGARR